jgi:hypothetical protein
MSKLQRHEVPGTAPPQKSRPVGYGMIVQVCAPIRRLEEGNFECGIAKQNRNDPPNASAVLDYVRLLVTLRSDWPLQRPFS